MKKELIFFIHNGKRLLQLKSLDDEIAVQNDIRHLSLPKALYNVASKYPQSIIVWCHEKLCSSLNLEFIKTTTAKSYTMYSYHSDEGTCIGNDIGYIDWGTFVHVNKKDRYPTWIMSSDCGMASASILLLSKQSVAAFDQLDQYLCSVAKKFQPDGLFTFSEPALLRLDHKKLIRNKWSKWELFQFVSNHYKKVWIIMLYLHLMRKHFFISPHYLLFLFNVRLSGETIDLHNTAINSLASISRHDTIDVIIPTIGRPQHVINFLEDLAAQTYPVNRVIIIEQKPDGSISDLRDALLRKWPFAILHECIQQTGACNARNMALRRVSSDWVFLADDDIRIDKQFLEYFFRTHSVINEHAYTFSCLQPGQKKTLNKITQWASFGSGCSIVKRSAITDKQFDMRYEFGFGEDADFGMQLRQSGIDIIYLPLPEILHLKAPMGGFRSKTEMPWVADQPKPAPTLTLYNKLYLTNEQYVGYTWFLFFSFYKHQTVKNPLVYINKMKKRIAKSEFWAKQLAERSI